MTEYTRVRPSGLILAKRGYCYFLYASMQHLEMDDKAEADAVNRLNHGRPVANRCYSPNMLGYTRKLCYFSDLEAYVLAHPELLELPALEV